MVKPTSTARVEREAADLVVHVAATLGRGVIELATALHAELAAAIPELRGDPTLLELLRASTETNVETCLHLAQGHLSLEEVNAPPAAVAYAHRLAQRATSANAMLRAYRLGQRRLLALASAEIAREEPEGQVAFAAVQSLQAITFDYVDRVSEQVVAEYEAERERWLANRNSVRVTMLAGLLAGEAPELGAAESALGYRLRQHHLGVVVWSDDRSASTIELRRLEAVVTDLGQSLGATGQPMFLPHDGTHGWGWIPLGRAGVEADVELLTANLSRNDTALRVALGSSAAGIAGFRSTHQEALRAYDVAVVAGPDAAPATTYADPGVRAAALLVKDLDATRDLVITALGDLATDDEQCARLRGTLFTFLNEKRSYVATAERVHLHKNTVKYRVDKAVQARGRPVDEDRFNLELALLACHWLGRSVLPG